MTAMTPCPAHLLLAVVLAVIAVIAVELVDPRETMVAIPYPLMVIKIKAAVAVQVVGELVALVVIPDLPAAVVVVMDNQ